MSSMLASRMRTRMLKLGYKASAEQFDPGTSRLCAPRRGVRLRLGLGSATTSSPGATTAGMRRSHCLAGALGPHHAPDRARHERAHPDLPLSPLDRGTGVRDARLSVPGRIVLGLGTGEALNEVPATGMAWPEQKERTARFKRSGAPDPGALDEGAGQLRGTLLPHLARDHLRSAPPPRALYHRSGRPVLAKLAG